jgi:small membrane protein
MVIQLLLALILLAALVLTWRRAKQNALSRRAAILWSLLWIGAAFVVLNPDVANWFANVVGVGRGVDAVLYLSVALIVYLLFRIFLRLEKTERDLTKLVRRIAIDEAQAKK